MSSQHSESTAGATPIPVTAWARRMFIPQATPYLVELKKSEEFKFGSSSTTETTPSTPFGCSVLMVGI